MNNSLIRILVVDDEALTRELLQVSLSIRGYYVAVACDGEEALRMFAMDTFDVVLSDILMPKKDGFQVLEAVRRQDPYIPFFFLTSQAQAHSKALLAGADGFMVKPFDYVALDQLIRQRLFAAIAA